MDLINQVRLLKEQTNSPEVRELCESFLKGEVQITESQLNEMTSNVESLIDSQPSTAKNLRDQMRDEEIAVSKKIAESLMNSWEISKRPSSNNSGSYLSSVDKEQKKSESNLLESLNNLSEDANAKNFIQAQSLNNLGILESIDKLRNCGIYQHPGFKMLAEKYTGLINFKRIPEFQLIHGFIQECSSFSWDSDVSSVLDSVQKKSQKFNREIEVVKVLESIKGSANRSFYSELSESLNEWLISENKSSALLSKNIQKWSFNPVVRNLINFLNISESAGTSRLELPVTNQGESRVERVYTIVNFDDNVTVFPIGRTLFEMRNSKISKSSQETISSLPSDYLNLVSIINSGNIKINEQGVFIPVGKTVVQLVENDNEKCVLVNGKKINFNTLNELGKYLSIETGSIVGGIKESAAIQNVINLYKGLDKIVELDFAKSIVSNIYEGVKINLIKHNGQIYLNRVNESMREDSLFKVSGTQAVQAVKEFLRYDISEGLTDFLEGDYKIKSIMINDRKKVLENLSKVEEQISKIETLMESDPSYGESKEIRSVHNLLNSELSVLKEKWNQINNEIKRFESDVYPELSLYEDTAFDIGDYVKVKESGETGKIISIDGSSGRYTVLLDNGKTSDFIVNEIVDLDTALSQAADQNADKNPEEEDYDETEEMKENDLNKSPLSVVEQKKILKNFSGGHGFSKAPGTKKGEIDIKVNDMQGYNLTMNETSKKESASQETYAKAPGDSKMGSQKNANPKDSLSKAPGNDNMTNGKIEGEKLLPDNAPETKKKTEFEANDETGEDYQTGYNLREGKNSQGTMVKAPEGKNAPKYKDKSTNNLIDGQDLEEAPGKEGDIDYEVNSEMGYNLDESDDLKKN